MNKLFFYLLFLLFSTSVFGQKVSTLIHDENKNFEAIHWHPNGTIISVDYSNGRIYKINLDGTVETLVINLINPAGGGFDENGIFYFSELATGKVFRLNEDNSTTLIASGLSQPTGIYPIPSSEILLVGNYQTNNAVKVNKTTGVINPWISGGGISGPDMIIPFGDEFLISNFNNTKIFKANFEGDSELFATIPASGFLGYIVEAGDFIYAATLGAKKIHRISMDGEVELFAGTGANGNLDGEVLDATFSNPNGICANIVGDTLLVTDGSRVRLISGLQTVNNSSSVLNLDLTLSPNPVHFMLNVQYDIDLHDSIEWNICKIDGEIILKNKVDSASNLNIDLKTLNAGNYIFLLKKDGQILGSKQFIKSQ